MKLNLAFPVYKEPLIFEEDETKDIYAGQYDLVDANSNTLYTKGVSSGPYNMVSAACSGYYKSWEELPNDVKEALEEEYDEHIASTL